MFHSMDISLMNISLSVSFVYSFLTMYLMTSYTNNLANDREYSVAVHDHEYSEK